MKPLKIWYEIFIHISYIQRSATNNNKTESYHLFSSHKIVVSFKRELSKRSYLVRFEITQYMFKNIIHNS